MSNKNRWMGNFYQDEDFSRAEQWQRLNRLKAHFLKESVNLI